MMTLRGFSVSHCAGCHRAFAYSSAEEMVSVPLENATVSYQSPRWTGRTRAGERLTLKEKSMRSRWYTSLQERFRK